MTISMARPVDFDIHKLIDSLRGTCTTIEEHLPDNMEWSDLTTSDHEAIDSNIFLCEECGWWCDIDEQKDDEKCTDCAEDDGE